MARTGADHDDESTTNNDADNGTHTERLRRHADEVEDVDGFDPVEWALNESERGYDDGVVGVRIVGDRDGGVTFDIDPSIVMKDPFRPDHIVAEHFGIIDAFDAVFDTLRDRLDLRKVSSSRVGTVKLDRDTGDIVDVELYDGGADEADEDAVAAVFVTDADDDTDDTNDDTTADTDADAPVRTDGGTDDADDVQQATFDDVTDTGDESATTPPTTFDDVIQTVDELSEDDHIAVTYAHRSRHTLDDYDRTTTVDGYVRTADVTFEESDGRTCDRFRLEFNSNPSDAEYDGTSYIVEDGGVNKKASNPSFVSKSTGPSVRHSEQLGRVDSIEIVEDADDGGSDDDDTDTDDGGTAEDDTDGCSHTDGELPCFACFQRDDTDADGDDGERLITDGGVETVTVYTIDGRDRTTDTSIAEALARRGHRVTAKTTRR